jgi:hypothetical protein
VLASGRHWTVPGSTGCGAYIRISNGLRSRLPFSLNTRVSAPQSEFFSCPNTNAVGERQLTHSGTLNVGLWPIVLKNSVGKKPIFEGLDEGAHWDSRNFRFWRLDRRFLDNRFALWRLCKTKRRSWHRGTQSLGHAPQVLCSCGEQELVVRTTEPS